MDTARKSWIGIAAGTGLLLACAGAVLDARPAPQPVPAAAAATTIADGRFKPVCKSGEVVDNRPDPAWVSASYGGDHCIAPPPPGPVNGLTASREQVVAAMAAAKRYDADAAVFRKCIRDFVALRGNDRPLGKTEQIIETHRIAASQHAQQTVAILTRNTINDFNRFGSDCPG